MAASLLRQPAVLLLQQSKAAAAALSASRPLATIGSPADQQQCGNGMPILAAAAAALLVGVVVTPISVSAAAPAPATAPADPYARPAEAKPLPSKITMYQYEVCPYCCKVKALLDYYKLPYTVVEVNPLTKSELKWSSYRKVPVLKLDDEVVVDSSAIMSRLDMDASPASGLARASSSGTASASASTNQGVSSKKGWFSKGSGGEAAASAPASAENVEEELRWRKWVDERFVKVLTANIYRNWDESVDTFKYITDQTGWGWGTREVARWAGAVLMWRIGKGMPAKYKIEGDLREALYACCNEYVDALAGRRFMGGDRPNLADLSVFGVLRAVHKTGAFTDVMTHSRIGLWYRAMEEVVGESARLGDA